MNFCKYISIFSLTMLWLSCGNCEDAVKYYKKQSYNIILKSKPHRGRAYSIKGINPNTGKNEKYYDDGGMLGIPFLELISIEDTLVKNVEDLKVYIHKKDTILVFPFKCEGEVYD